MPIHDPMEVDEPESLQLRQLQELALRHTQQEVTTSGDFNWPVSVIPWRTPVNPMEVGMYTPRRGEVVLRDNRTYYNPHPDFQLPPVYASRSNNVVVETSSSNTQPEIQLFEPPLVITDAMLQRTPEEAISRLLSRRTASNLQ